MEQKGNLPFVFIYCYRFMHGADIARDGNSSISLGETIPKEKILLKMNC